MYLKVNAEILFYYEETHFLKLTNRLKNLKYLWRWTLSNDNTDRKIYNFNVVYHYYNKSKNIYMTFVI